MLAFLVTKKDADLAPIVENTQGPCFIYFYAEGVANTLKPAHITTDTRYAYCPTSAQLHNTCPKTGYEKISLTQWFAILSKSSQFKQIS